MLCPDGWSHFNLSCYILIKKSLSWSVAEGYCNKLGGHLASVHSLEENDFISGLADGEYWIGANDMKTEGQWVWSDGSALGYTNWFAGEPNDSSPPYYGREDCMHYRKYSSGRKQWNDQNCDKTYNFVCKIVV